MMSGRDLFVDSKQIDFERMKILSNLGSLGLVVMGGASCTKGHGFESQHRIPDGHFSHLFVVRIVTFLSKDKNKQKEAEDGPLKHF